jgi:tetratricopeptide (TPR) repeat protein
VSDDIRRWSDELARDPASRVFVPLADTLRRRGQLDLALKVATRGLERHPHDADAHDLLARIWIDRGEVERAIDEWSMALSVAPQHVGALKGMGFACFQVRRTADAERYLQAAASLDPDDGTIGSALARVRAPAPPGAASQPATEGATATNGARRLAEAASAPPDTKARHPHPTAAAPGLFFADLLGDAEQAALLLDGQGLVLAGTYIVADGRDVAQDVAGALSGVSDEARRAMRHLGLGDWSSLVFETEAASVAMAPVAHGPEAGLVLVAAARSVPLGLVRRLLLRVVERSTAWLAGTPAGQDGP